MTAIGLTNAATGGNTIRSPSQRASHPQPSDLFGRVSRPKASLFRWGGPVVDVGVYRLSALPDGESTTRGRGVKEKPVQKVLIVRKPYLHQPNGPLPPIRPKEEV
jgi:hypothetical protein